MEANIIRISQADCPESSRGEYMHGSARSNGVLSVDLSRRHSRDHRASPISTVVRNK